MIVGFTPSRVVSSPPPSTSWRTLQGGTEGGHTNQWSYLLYSRTTTNGYRYAKTQLWVHGNMNESVTEVNGEYACGTVLGGMIIFPDDFSFPSEFSGSLTTNTANTNYTANQLTEAQWSLLEKAGAVFLPAAGDRFGTSVIDLGEEGHYWSSTTYSTVSDAYRLFFKDSSITITYDFRFYGFSVRLVCP